MQKKTQTYDYLCFSELAYEFDASDAKTTESKIKRRLKYYPLPSYDQERINIIRQLKNELYAEISQGLTSKYNHKIDSDYSALADFDTKKMISDYLKKYPKVSNSDLERITNFAIYIYYLR